MKNTDEIRTQNKRLPEFTNDISILYEKKTKMVTASKGRPKLIMKICSQGSEP